MGLPFAGAPYFCWDMSMQPVTSILKSTAVASIVVHYPNIQGLPLDRLAAAALEH